MPDTQLEDVTIHCGEVSSGSLAYNPDRISFMSCQQKGTP